MTTLVNWLLVTCNIIAKCRCFLPGYIPSDLHRHIQIEEKQYIVKRIKARIHRWRREVSGPE